MSQVSAFGGGLFKPTSYCFLLLLLLLLLILLISQMFLRFFVLISKLDLYMLANHCEWKHLPK